LVIYQESLHDAVSTKYKILLFAVVIILLEVNVKVLLAAVKVVVTMVVIVFCGPIYTECIPISFSATLIFTYGLVTDRTLIS